MPNRQRNLGINIRVTPAEKKKIERNARKCKLTVSEYLRQLAMNREPKELPSDEIFVNLEKIREASGYLASLSASENITELKEKTVAVSKFLNRLHLETMQLVLHAKTDTTSNNEVNTDGND